MNHIEFRVSPWKYHHFQRRGALAAHCSRIDPRARPSGRSAEICSGCGSQKSGSRKSYGADTSADTASHAAAILSRLWVLVFHLFQNEVMHCLWTLCFCQFCILLYWNPFGLIGPHMAHMPPGTFAKCPQRPHPQAPAPWRADCRLRDLESESPP